ncbi:hypothetical protein [Streptomyces sp. NPDC001741]|uniref:hypothetical protein n=1 Tax=Streptomyces sp. NPDC001741 TaxID=3364605 RepID=UPI003699BD91
MGADRRQRIRRAFVGAASGPAVALLLTSCSGYYPVAVDSAEQMTGMWSDFSGATVEFEDDGTFVAEGFDTKDIVGWGCSGFAGRQHGTWTPSGTYGEVTFDGVDCEDMQLAFYGSPSSFVACFTRDVTSGGCTHEFSREDG